MGANQQIMAALAAGAASTTITIGGRAGDTFSGMQDALMIADYGLPNTNLPTETRSQAYPFLIRPDLSGIPSGKTITGASWKFNTQSGNTPSLTITMRRLLRAWVESEASANNWASGSAWTTQYAAGDGTDRVATASCTLSYAGGYVTGDMTSTGNTQLIADIQAIVNGSAVNNGWLCDSNQLSLVLPADATAAFRPQLTVSYIP